MAQIIIHTNDNDGISVTYPTPEYLESHTIQDVLSKDCPDHAIIVDSSILPESDNDFFDAWELNNSIVSVNIKKAIAIQQNLLNSLAKTEAQYRMTNTASGIDNKLVDADWLALLTTARSTISSATTTQELRDAIVPIQSAITANK